MSQLIRSKKTGFAAFVALLAAGLASAGYFAGTGGMLVAETKAPAISPADPAVAHANALSHAFRASAERVLPAVVAIQNESKPRMVRRELPRGEQPRRSQPMPQLPKEFGELDPLLKKFFEGGPGIEGFEGFDQLPNMPRQSSGSGVIIDPSGIILTNNHVVAGDGKVTVKLHDGREFVATEVKTDPNTDVAVIRIKANGALPFAELGDSDKMQIGDWVLALGQPFGLQDTVTAGIVSAKDRGIGIMRHEEFIQTDAAINPGNSGGPLVNLQGQVIGVNTAISSRGGGFEGIGFAVPVNVARWVSDQLVKNGKVQRAYLGIGIQPLDQDLADQLGVSTPGGALVTDVQPDSPAAAAGLKPQDVIVSFNGLPIGSHRQLSAVVGRTPIGKAVPVVVYRDGKETKLHVTVREAPANYGAIAEQDVQRDQPAEAAQFNKLGLEVAPLTADVAGQLGIKESAGVVITAVEEGSVADRAGLDASMAIVQVGRQQVKSVAEFDAAIASGSLDKGILVLVKSAEGSRFVVLKSE
ncbi:MAG: Do family serine endopeptidase [Planctomycetaceae bacterium]|nr:Do family serine endopeptidase [Planctomycetaceae bacterium]